MSEQKAKPEKPSNQGTDGTPTGQSSQGTPPRDWRRLIGHEERGQNPEHIRLIDSTVQRREHKSDDK